jgi:hypothetical protein
MEKFKRGVSIDQRLGKGGSDTVRNQRLGVGERVGIAVKVGL